MLKRVPNSKAQKTADESASSAPTSVTAEHGNGTDGPRRGRGRGRGRGGAEGTRGRGRGRGRGGDTGPRIGERVTLSSADVGYAPPAPVTGGRSKNLQLGTEEIIGYISEEEQRKTVKTKREIKKERPASPTDVQGPIARMKKRQIYEGSTQGGGYEALWNEALKITHIRTVPDIPPLKDKVIPANPIPRTLAVEFLNKFSRRTQDVNEPEHISVKSTEFLTFTNESFKSRYDTTLVASKLAGDVWRNIFEMPHLFDALICFQLPNSLKVLTAKNVDDTLEDLLVAKQNVQKEENDIGPHSEKKSKTRYHCLQNFHHTQPFGKIQLLKSGRVVLRIGDRVLDLCLASNRYEANIGAIFESEGFDGKPKASRRDSMFDGYQNKIYSLGMIEHYFTTFYDYEKIFEVADENDETGWLNARSCQTAE
uniref:Uncharacterized protein n=1 Tax=Panagrolaimus sp. JU765 TaxID=591449 RepID=A0AC34Q7B9_9BILA